MFVFVTVTATVVRWRLHAHRNTMVQMADSHVVRRAMQAGITGFKVCRIRLKLQTLTRRCLALKNNSWWRLWINKYRSRVRCRQVLNSMFAMTRTSNKSISNIAFHRWKSTVINLRVQDTRKKQVLVRILQHALFSSMKRTFDKWKSVNNYLIRLQVDNSLLAVTQKLQPALSRVFSYLRDPLASFSAVTADIIALLKEFLAGFEVDVFMLSTDGSLWSSQTRMRASRDLNRSSRLLSVTEEDDRGHGSGLRRSRYSSPASSPNPRHLPPPLSVSPGRSPTRYSLNESYGHSPATSGKFDRSSDPSFRVSFGEAGIIDHCLQSGIGRVYVYSKRGGSTSPTSPTSSLIFSPVPKDKHTLNVESVKRDLVVSAVFPLEHEGVVTGALQLLPITASHEDTPTQRLIDSIAMSSDVSIIALSESSSSSSRHTTLKFDSGKNLRMATAVHHLSRLLELPMRTSIALMQITSLLSELIALERSGGNSTSRKGSRVVASSEERVQLESTIQELLSKEKQSQEKMSRLEKSRAKHIKICTALKNVMSFTCLITYCT